MRTNHVKHAALAGETLFGTWIHTLGSLQTPQVLATAGFDFVYVDMEHSCFSIETVGALCSTALNAGIVPVVRPSDKEHFLISRPLDNGAMGILAPHVDNVGHARKVVRAVKFPPLGERGSQPASIHTSFAATSAAEYMEWSNRESLVMVLLESREALENIDEILAVEGIDGGVIGRGDLSIEMGLQGDRWHPDVTAAVELLIDASHRHAKVPGLLVESLDDAHEWVGKGIRLPVYGSEVAMLRNAGTEAIRHMRSAIGS